jgi:hypothetical protein
VNDACAFPAVTTTSCTPNYYNLDLTHFRLNLRPLCSSAGTIYGRLTHEATCYEFDQVNFYIIKSSFPLNIGSDFLTTHPDLARNDFSLDGSRLKLTLKNDQQLKLSWSAFDHPTQSLLKTSSTAQLIKDPSTNHHVTFDTSLFKGADLDALVDYNALLSLDKRDLTNSKLTRWKTRLAEPNTSPVADDNCVGQFYKSDHDDRLKVNGTFVLKMHASPLPVHDASKLLIIDWGGKSRIALPESLIAHFCKSAHDPEDHLKVYF